MYTKLPQMKTDRLKMLNLHSKRFKAKSADSLINIYNPFTSVSDTHYQK